ncbi:hypothetical protein PPL_02184 [Heterostelium album PN500]|uniref:Uncharacterized protein n=1 Tax=Heterostelium pallidum (strain ATCC 26659 / Pp 5 / PN500) TaxID=670386 RepID=D3B1L0_HETP5|nr:hypothetical protein PPL_02184 [Heterostelium album PN500]EFA85184.1 hypothetical protein PPL_02184 [Heterostelium album PN500]|eukprot:XP_020437293.1 hypothetical protein PPL_02184 [Heterostelium album PN500]
MENTYKEEDKTTTGTITSTTNNNNDYNQKDNEKKKKQKMTLKTASKPKLVDAIIVRREKDLNLQKILHDNNPSLQFHRGYVEYNLPALIIIKILQYYWKLSTNHTSPLYSYRDALVLTLINKQFFCVVNEMFISTKLIQKYIDIDEIEEAGDRHPYWHDVFYYDYNGRRRYQSKYNPEYEYSTDRVSIEFGYAHLLKPWCPFKNIVKLKVSTTVMESLMRSTSSIHLQHVLSTVEKLNIVSDQKGSITIQSVKSIGITMYNLRYLKLPFAFSRSHFKVMDVFKSLKKIDFGCFHPDLYTIIPSIEQVYSIKLDIVAIPLSNRNIVTNLGGVCLSKRDYGGCFEFPNLKELAFDRETNINIFTHFRESTLNITYLSIHLKTNLKEWFPIIERLRSIITIHDQCQYSNHENDGLALCNQFKQSLSPTLSRFIITTDKVFDASNYLLDMGYHLSFETTKYHKKPSSLRKLYFNKIK